MIRTLVLSAVAVVLLRGAAGAEEPNPMNAVLEIQKKLSERIDFSVPAPTTLDKLLDQLLTQQDIPYEVNEAAFVQAMLDRDVVKKTEIEPISKLHGVSRADVLRRLLQRIPAADEAGEAAYVLRRGHVEITTRGAKTVEARGVRTPAGDDLASASVPPPPLAYAVFDDTPLPDALKELAHSTDSTIILDGRTIADAKAKVTAELNGVPVDVAVQLLADMANLKMVRIANVYYVTSVKNAEALQKEEDKRREGPSDNPTVSHRGGGSALAAPKPSRQAVERTAAEGDTRGMAAQLPVRPLLALTTIAAAPAPADNDENTPAYRAMITQKKLGKRIDYELPIQSTLGKVLNELLDRQDIPFTVNERAFVKAGQKEDVVKTTEVGPLDKMTQVSRRVVLDTLLSKIPAKTDGGVVMCVIRPGHVEITTRRAYLDEFFPGRDEAAPPPLVHDVFRKAVLRDALADLAETTGASVVLDPRVSDEAAEKVSAAFAAVPLDTAVRVLADEAGLKLVRVDDVYYVTSRKHADEMRKEEDGRKREGKPVPPAMPLAR